MEAPMLLSAVDTESASYAFGLWFGRVGIPALGLWLVIHGIRRKRTDNARGDGFIAGGAIAILIGLSSIAVALVDSRDDPSGGNVESRQPVKDPGPAVVYDDCDAAVAGVQKMFTNSITSASEGRIDRVRTVMIAMPRTIVANEDCFPAESVAGARDVEDTKMTEPEGIDRQPAECRQTIRDVFDLLNFAAGLKSNAPEMSDKAANGFAELSSANPDCFTDDDVRTMKKKLADSNLN
jgi:hypothetical protein